MSWNENAGLRVGTFCDLPRFPKRVRYWHLRDLTGHLGRACDNHVGLQVDPRDCGM